MLKQIKIALFLVLISNNLFSQASFYGSFSSLSISNTPKINLGFSIGSNIVLNDEKKLFSIGFNFFVPKKYDYTSTAKAIDFTTTFPEEINIASSLKISYYSFNMALIRYFSGNESGEFNAYFKYGIKLIQSYFQGIRSEFDQNSYRLLDHYLLSSNLKAKGREYSQAFFLGLGVEKKIGRFLVYSEFNYARVFRFIPLKNVYPIFFQPYGTKNCFQINLGIRILRL